MALVVPTRNDTREEVHCRSAHPKIDVRLFPGDTSWIGGRSSFGEVARSPQGLGLQSPKLSLWQNLSGGSCRSGDRGIDANRELSVGGYLELKVLKRAARWPTRHCASAAER